MILRALTLDNETVYFTVTDAPVCINSKHTILCNKHNSPIIVSKTIARGPLEADLFEFDFVVDKETSKFIGYVVYTDGFYIWNPHNQEMTPIRDTSRYKFLDNTRAYRTDELNAIRSSIRFKGNDRLFRLNRIMYSDGEFVFVELKGCTGPIKLSRVMLCTGVGEDRNEMQFGQHLNDGVIELHEYHPMVKLYKGGYRKLEVKDYE